MVQYHHGRLAVQRTHPRAQLIGVLIVMAVMSGLLLAWAKRQGWW
jgi:hypothetical protein